MKIKKLKCLPKIKCIMHRGMSDEGKESSRQLQNTLNESHPEIAKIAGKMEMTEDVNKQRDLFRINH